MVKVIIESCKKLNETAIHNYRVGEFVDWDGDEWEVVEINAEEGLITLENMDGDNRVTVDVDELEEGLSESKKSSKKESKVRIARRKEFDNGHVLHTWYNWSMEDAEQKAKEASLQDPNDIYYVAIDDVMNPSSDYRWINSEKYKYDQVEIRDGKPHIKNESSSKKESNEPEYDDTYEDGIKAGKDDYETGHPMDPEDMDRFSKEFQDGYWKGFYDAQEEANEELEESNSKKESEESNSKKESAEDHPAVKKVKEIVAREFSDFTVKGPVPENYDYKEGKDQFFIAVPEDSLEGREVEKMLQRVESEFPDFEYEGYDWDNRYWFNVNKE